MLLLLAPSKTQQPIDFDYKLISQPTFLQQAKQLNELLQQKTAEEIATLMKTSEKITNNTIDMIGKFTVPFTKTNSHPAIFTFQGDAYSNLTPTKWDTTQLEHAQKHLLILSGLYGALRPLDLMQPYRLEMGLKLENINGSNLYQFWGESITNMINQHLQTCEHKTVINLASTEYSKSIVKKKLVGDMIEIVFRQEKEAKLKTIPIYSKRARGAMANFVVMRKLNRPDQLKDFNEDGYSFDKSSSTATKWIFNCKLD